MKEDPNAYGCHDVYHPSFASPPLYNYNPEAMLSGISDFMFEVSTGTRDFRTCIEELAFNHL